MRLDDARDAEAGQEATDALGGIQVRDRATVLRFPAGQAQPDNEVLPRPLGVEHYAELRAGLHVLQQPRYHPLWMRSMMDCAKGVDEIEIAHELVKLLDVALPSERDFGVHGTTVSARPPVRRTTGTVP